MIWREEQLNTLEKHKAARRIQNRWICRKYAGKMFVTSLTQTKADDEVQELHSKSKSATRSEEKGAARALEARGAAERPSSEGSEDLDVFLDHRVEN